MYSWELNDETFSYCIAHHRILTNFNLINKKILSKCPAVLLTELGDVIQHLNSMETSCLIHLAELLPDEAGVVVLQDVLQIRSIVSSYKYIVIRNIIIVSGSTRDSCIVNAHSMNCGCNSFFEDSRKKQQYK